MDSPREQVTKWRGKRSFREAATELGCDHSLLRKIEAGSRRPGRDTAVQIRDKIGIPVEAWSEATVQAAPAPSEPEPASHESGEHAAVESDAPASGAAQ